MARRGLEFPEAILLAVVAEMDDVGLHLVHGLQQVRKTEPSPANQSTVVVDLLECVFLQQESDQQMLNRPHN